jgi:tight adherence protein B
MGLALFAFILFSGAVLGGYAALTFLPDFIASRKLNERLRDVATPGGVIPDDESVLKQRKEGPLPAVDRLVANTKTGSGLARLIERSGVRTTPSAVVVFAIALAGIAAFLTATFVRVPYVPIAAALVGFATPFLYLMNRRKARIRRFEEQFPEALDLLSRAIRAGHAFQTAMGMVADELPDPVGPEFKTTFDQQNFGMPLKDALNQLAERVTLLDVRFFVTAVLIQRDTGGNLAEILDNLAHVVRERFKILRQVRVHTAHGRFTGYVLMALPATLAVALMFINPDHINLLFKEHMGQVMVAGAIVMQTIGYFWIRWVIKIEV